MSQTPTTLCQVVPYENEIHRGNLKPICYRIHGSALCQSYQSRITSHVNQTPFSGPAPHNTPELPPLLPASPPENRALSEWGKFGKVVIHLSAQSYPRLISLRARNSSITDGPPRTLSKPPPNSSIVIIFP